MDFCAMDMPRYQRGDLEELPETEALTLAGVAKALSDPIRVQMIHLLRQRPDLCTCEFELLLGLSQSKASYHLKILLDAGLITRETYRTWSHYRLRDATLLDQLRAFVPQVPTYALSS